MAQAAGLRCQLGCQVGESSILGAAGRCFALCAPDLAFYEGGYSRILLRADIAKPSVILGWRGKIRGSATPQVRVALLEPHTKESIKI